MIHDIDQSLQALVKRDVLDGSEVEISFEAPTRDWAARRNTPTVDLYLYDVREDLDRRNAGLEDVRDGNGRLTGRRPGPRRFKLSYLVTAWTQRAEDEHRLLSALLGCFVRYDALPPEVLATPLADQTLPVIISIALPPPEDRQPADVWTALGGELKPSLDLVLVAPLDEGRMRPAGPLVLEEPRVRMGPAGEETDMPSARGRRSARKAPVPAADLETIRGGTEDQPGRTVHVRRMPDR